MKYIEPELGGEKRGMKFNLNTLKFIGELTGVDAFKFLFDSTTLAGLIDGVSIIAHAAMLSNKQQDIKAEDVKQWVGEFDMAELLVITNAYTGLLKTNATGESSGNTQQ